MLISTLSLSSGKRPSSSRGRSPVAGGGAPFWANAPGAARTSRRIERIMVLRILSSF
jgi:hypothetical protein